MKSNRVQGNIGCKIGSEKLPLGSWRLSAGLLVSANFDRLRGWGTCSPSLRVVCQRRGAGFTFFMATTRADAGDPIGFGGRR